jgi:hypothetical protein
MRSTTPLSAKLMTRTSLSLGLAVVLATLGCRAVNESASAWSPDGTGGLDDSEDGSAESSVGDADTSSDAGDEPADTTAGDDGTDDGGTDDTGGVPIDCTPAWSEPFIGSPCATDNDCPYDGGFCLRDDEGFPCGTCSLACASLCPDIDGAPETFCIDGADVGLPSAGHCLSQCDNALPGAEGCRDGYVCNVLARFDGTDVADVCIPEAFDSGQELVDEIDHAFLIDHFGGDPTVSAFDFVEDVDGFQLYLDEVGVQHVTASDLAEPYNQAAATMCGFDLLLPAQEEWEKAAALALFTDVLTELVGEPIFMRNWWRPPCYNEAVGGAAGGDHPDADAVDLDFSSPATRAIAQQFLCDTYWNMDIVTPEQILPGSDLDPRLAMSIGLGGVTIHLGVLSAGGRRFWYYDSYTAEPGAGNCW